MTDVNASVVYFDGSCPLCSREIDFYKRQRGKENVCWIDVSSIVTKNIEPGFTKKAALDRFHVKLENGDMVSGARAFISLWKALDNFSKAGQFLDQPWIMYILEHLYNGFLVVRPPISRLLKMIQK